MNISTSTGKKHRHLKILPIGALSWTFLGHVIKLTVSKIEASKQMSYLPKKESYDNVKKDIVVWCIQISYFTFWCCATKKTGGSK